MLAAIESWGSLARRRLSQAIKAALRLHFRGLNAKTTLAKRPGAQARLRDGARATRDPVRRLGTKLAPTPIDLAAEAPKSPSKQTLPAQLALGLLIFLRRAQGGLHLLDSSGRVMIYGATWARQLAASRPARKLSLVDKLVSFAIVSSGACLRTIGD